MYMEMAHNMESIAGVGWPYLAYITTQYDVLENTHTPSNLYGTRKGSKWELFDPPPAQQD